jgi:CheY-like chemotaxis protein
VKLTIRRADTNRRFASRSLDKATEVIALGVRDTGVGIAKDKQQLIFEAFQQADGTTSRRYGGTGLGLSISREIARVLGGEIHVDSTPGRGSTFTLFLPTKLPALEGTGLELDDATRLDFRAPVSESVEEEPTKPASVEQRRASVADDRDSVKSTDRVVMIVENDEAFARDLLGVVRQSGAFKGIVARSGEEAIELAHAVHPAALTLDIDMPGVDGWALVDRLKHHPRTRNIPVHIISGIRGRPRGLAGGTIAYLEKPSTSTANDAVNQLARFVDGQAKRLLLVEDDEARRTSISKQLDEEAEGVGVTGVTLEEARAELARKRYDGVLLALGFDNGAAGRGGPESNGFAFLELVKRDSGTRDLPIIVYVGRELSPEELAHLRRLAPTIDIKEIKSPERLLEETTQFLGRIEAKPQEQVQRRPDRPQREENLLAGKRVLIVDDDVRNVFSLTSALENYGMQVSFAENGRTAIAMLKASQETDIVLMDVMMPEMDGYETTRSIRQIPELRNLPIIALTAKAMKGDREKCIAAGASDYITKPVDTDRLLSLMRVWLYR